MQKILNSDDYVAHPWPEYQDYMGEDWFLKECYYCSDKDVYFIPKNRVKPSKDVYKIVPTRQYSGGCALVAANSKEEAKAKFIEDDYYAFLIEDGECEIYQVPELSCDTNECVVIFNTIYIE